MAARTPVLRIRQLDPSHPPRTGGRTAFLKLPWIAVTEVRIGFLAATGHRRIPGGGSEAGLRRSSRLTLRRSIEEHGTLYREPPGAAAPAPTGR